ncbi:hypothetical protein E4U21_005666 [Claviceps maximensis]|nr:hypothetical protein E4U21_005666 [Claviceps maximensis]
MSTRKNRQDEEEEELVSLPEEEDGDEEEDLSLKSLLVRLACTLRTASKSVRQVTKAQDFVESRLLMDMYYHQHLQQLDSSYGMRISARHVPLKTLISRGDVVKSLSLTPLSLVRYVSTGDEDDVAEEQDEEEDADEGESQSKENEDAKAEVDETGADSDAEDAAKDEVVHDDEPPLKKQKTTDVINRNGVIGETTDGDHSKQKDATIGAEVDAKTAAEAEAEAEADSDSVEIKNLISVREAAKGTEAPLTSAEIETDAAAAGDCNA